MMALARNLGEWTMALLHRDVAIRMMDFPRHQGEGMMDLPRFPGGWIMNLPQHKEGGMMTLLPQDATTDSYRGATLLAPRWEDNHHEAALQVQLAMAMDLHPAHEPQAPLEKNTAHCHRILAPQAPWLMDTALHLGPSASSRTHRRIISKSMSSISLSPPYTVNQNASWHPGRSCSCPPNLRLFPNSPLRLPFQRR